MAHSLGACGVVISPFRGVESRARLSRASVSSRCTARCSVGSQQDPCTGPIQQLTALKTAAAGALLSACVLLAPPALADLNQAEAQIGGEFGIGTSKQYGEAEINGKDFHGEDLRRSNFTAASCRNCNFKDTKLQGTYFIKAVVAKANFENADLSDALMDRAVINQANLKNAILERVIFTRSDFGGADIEGADFSNALVDKTQQIALCRYATGQNAFTGVDTRKSLGCGSRRKFASSAPSSDEGPQVADDQKKAFQSTMPTYRQ